MLRNVSLFPATSLPLITDIYVVNAAGSGAVNVTGTSDADDCYPSRQPL